MMHHEIQTARQADILARAAHRRLVREAEKAAKAEKSEKAKQAARAAAERRNPYARAA
ncbi:hypothetical protein [Streptomyces beijiangensis]|uniref:Uncharacterized protein n=1 Tax=Streptomyces beijiangensis TaxID=163361 RepID=A0A939FAK2_9ACTN|nr:hypothetical protein [Streptomyces beijiangensis]MBO0514739.1 hypothetical protein [Streptomyces beijiangensis]